MGSGGTPTLWPPGNEAGAHCAVNVLKIDAPLSFIHNAFTDEPGIRNSGVDLVIQPDVNFGQSPELSLMVELSSANRTISIG